MLKIETMALGLYQTNTYIIYAENSNACCIIDPGYDAPAILDRLNALALTPEAILLTHGHFDHVGAVRELVAHTDCAVYLCADDLAMPTMLTAGPLYYTHTYAEGSNLSVAGLSVRVLHTPGHTPGSVCLLVENALFSGDTLFAGSCGRTDLPGGNRQTIAASLRRLAAMEADFAVYPGHGEATRLSDEKKYNPYLR